PHPFNECHHSPFGVAGSVEPAGAGGATRYRGAPGQGSCAVRHPCLPGTPADRGAGGFTAPSLIRLTRVVNGGWLPRGRRSERHTGTTSTTTDRNGELFIPGSAPLINQSPPEINDDRQPGTTVPAATAVARGAEAGGAPCQTRPSPGSCATPAPGSRVPPARSRPTA